MRFLRLKARRGAKKAAIAVAASILTTVYHMLRDGTYYQDLGPEYFARRTRPKPQPGSPLVIKSKSELPHDTSDSASR